MRVYVATAFLLTGCAAYALQEPLQPTAAQVVVEKKTKTEEIKQVFVMVCDSAPHKLIILDESGKWMHRVKEADIRIDNGNSTVRCMLYEGSFKPTSPEVKTWRLAQLKSITEAEFQSHIDNLQTDPDAVKKAMAQATSVKK